MEDVELSDSSEVRQQLLVVNNRKISHDKGYNNPEILDQKSHEYFAIEMLSYRPGVFLMIGIAASYDAVFIGSIKLAFQSRTRNSLETYKPFVHLEGLFVSVHFAFTKLQFP